MRAALTLCVKDLAEFVSNGRAVLLALVFPCLFVCLVGQLRTQPTSFRVLMTGAAPGGSPMETAIRKTAEALAELSIFDVQVEAATPLDPRAALEGRQYDVLVAPVEGGWRVFTASTDPFRLAQLQQIAPRLQAALDGARRAAEPPATSGSGVIDAVRANLAEMGRLARALQAPTALAGPVGNIRQAHPGPANAPPTQPTSAPLSAVDARARLREALNRAVRALDPVLTAKPDAFGIRALQNRVRSLEGPLGALDARSTSSDQAVVQQDVQALVDGIRTVTASISNDDAPRQVSRVVDQRAIIAGAVAESSRSLFSYYPTASERPRALLPETAALIVCVLPFVLCCHALVREREEKTFEVLRCVPGLSDAGLLAGKAAAAVIVTLTSFASVIAVLHMLFGMFVKPDLASLIVLTIVPAATASALLGLAISAILTSSLQATIASAVFLLVQSLVGGFLYPVVAGGTGFMRALSAAFPLTSAIPSLRVWAFGATTPPTATTVQLLVLVAVYAVMAKVLLARVAGR